MLQKGKIYWQEFCKWVRFHKPTSATLTDWRRFNKRFKKEAPIRYFLLEIVPHFYRVRIRRPVHDFVWWFIYRLHPRHRYHVIKTGLKPGYTENEDLMLHAVFSLVCDYVEVELGLWRANASKKYRCRQRGESHIRNFITEFENDSMEAEHVAFYKELLEIYIWWKDVYTNHNPYSEKGINPMRVHNNNKDSLLSSLFAGDDIPEIVARQTTDWMTRNEERALMFEAETDRMLKRAISVRHLMWT